MSVGSPTALNYNKGGILMDKNSLAHTTWECKYHIVFAPKYRRKVIYQKIRTDIGHILSELCKKKWRELRLGTVFSTNYGYHSVDNDYYEWC